MHDYYRRKKLKNAIHMSEANVAAAQSSHSNKRCEATPCCQQAQTRSTQFPVFAGTATATLFPLTGICMVSAARLNTVSKSRCKKVISGPKFLHK